MASKRRQILDYLVATVFPAITTGNGYNTSPQTIRRGLVEVDALTDDKFPAILVAHATENRHNMNAFEFQSKMETLIWGYVKKDDGSETGLMQQVDDFVEDVTKAIEQDRKLGGLSKWLEIKTVTTDDGDGMPYGAFAMMVEIVYVSKGILP